jgi:hypothetical protein
MPVRPVWSRGVVNTSYTLSMDTLSTLESRARRGFSSRICGDTTMGCGECLCLLVYVWWWWWWCGGGVCGGGGGVGVKMDRK